MNHIRPVQIALQHTDTPIRIAHASYSTARRQVDPDYPRGLQCNAHYYETNYTQVFNETDASNEIDATSATTYMYTYTPASL
jgi:hypothetical protein